MNLYQCPKCQQATVYRDDLRGEYHCDNGCGFHASEAPGPVVRTI